MNRALLIGAIATLVMAGSAPRAWSFDLKDVVAMHEDSISDELIIEKIQHSGESFDLDAGDLRELKAAGVSDRVITALLRTEDQGDEEDDGGYRYAHPYRAYSYGPEGVRFLVGN
ncbi:MAG: hypothetical protein HZB25_06100 [Candidatus Eisenbacteria bacterium]|nr:hypothetical protein [Candidatus Eisenbacteria bacterium]